LKFTGDCLLTNFNVTSGGVVNRTGYYTPRLKIWIKHFVLLRVLRGESILFLVVSSR